MINVGFIQKTTRIIMFVTVVVAVVGHSGDVVSGNIVVINIMLSPNVGM